jgi:hypothetical protein
MSPNIKRMYSIWWHKVLILEIHSRCFYHGFKYASSIFELFCTVTILKNETQNLSPTVNETVSSTYWTICIFDRLYIIVEVFNFPPDFHSCLFVAKWYYRDSLIETIHVHKANTSSLMLIFNLVVCCSQCLCYKTENKTKAIYTATKWHLMHYNYLYSQI